MMEATASDIKSLLLNISQDLSNDDVKRLAFLASATEVGLGPEKFDNALAFLKELENRELVTNNGYNYLRKLLRISGRTDQADKLPETNESCRDICDFRVGLFEIFTDMKEEDVKHMSFLQKIPQGICTKISDGIDLCLYLIKSAGLKPGHTDFLESNLGEIGRHDLANKAKTLQGAVAAPRETSNLSARPKVENTRTKIHEKPLPETKCKVFRPEDYKHVDNYVTKLSKDVIYEPIAKAVKKITNAGKWKKDELAVIRALFFWMANLNYEEIESERRVIGSASDYILKRKEDPSQIGQLMKDFCGLVGIQCKVVKGNKQIEDLDSGDVETIPAYWNNVFVAGGWRPVQPRAQVYKHGYIEAEKWNPLERSEFCPQPVGLSSNAEVHVDEFYFLANQETFQKIFIPDRADDKSFSDNSFADNVLLQDGFLELELYFTQGSIKTGTVTTETGIVEICFGLPVRRSKSYTFEHCLYTEGAVRAESLKQPLERYIIYAQEQDKLKYRLRIPLTGNFKFKVWGGVDELSPCFTYFIKCTNVDPELCKPLPAVPESGWGPVPAAEELGLRPTTHVAFEVNCPSGQASISLTLDEEAELQQSLKHIELDQSDLANCCVVERERDQVHLYLRLPTQGEFALQLFASCLQGGVGSVVNALNYLIESGATARPFPNLLNDTVGDHKPVSEAYKTTVSPHLESNWLQVKNQSYEVQFCTEPDVTLMFELHSNNVKAAVKMGCTVKRLDKRTWYVFLTLPVQAEYALNVFARQDGDAPSAIFGAHSFLISTLGTGDKVMPLDEKVKKIPTHSMCVDCGEARFPIKSFGKNIVFTLGPRTGPQAWLPSKTRLIEGQPESVLITDFEQAGEYFVYTYSHDQRSHTVKAIARHNVSKVQNESISKPISTTNGIIQIKPSDMSEVCSYNMPPDGVYQVAKAFLLLLGYHSAEIQSWPRLQRVLTEEEGKSVLRKLSQFDVNKVTSETAQTVQQLLQKARRSKNAISGSGIITLYHWNMEVLQMMREKGLCKEGDEKRGNKGSMFAPWNRGHTFYK